MIGNGRVRNEGNKNQPINVGLYKYVYSFIAFIVHRVRAWAFNSRWKMYDNNFM